MIAASVAKSCPAVVPWNRALQSCPECSRALESCHGIVPRNRASESCPGIVHRNRAPESCPAVMPGVVPWKRALETCPGVVLWSRALESCPGVVPRSRALKTDASREVRQLADSLRTVASHPKSRQSSGVTDSRDRLQGATPGHVCGARLEYAARGVIAGASAEDVAGHDSRARFQCMIAGHGFIANPA